MRMDKGKPFMHVEADFDPRGEQEREHGKIPTFSEAFLYPTVGKGDARFILGVAEEYEHIIDALGPQAVRAILNVKPRLVQRLGTGKLVTDNLEDARDYSDLDREARHPSQIIIDEGGAEKVWHLLHAEYSSLFNPEDSMDSDSLRLYHKLTDMLGEWEQGQRQKEIDRLPEKLAKQQERREIHARDRERKRQMREAREAIVNALRGEGDKDAALTMYEEAFGKLPEPVEP